jgi:hypothetical protein
MFAEVANRPTARDLLKQKLEKCKAKHQEAAELQQAIQDHDAEQAQIQAAHEAAIRQEGLTNLDIIQKNIAHEDRQRTARKVRKKLEERRAEILKEAGPIDVIYNQLFEEGSERKRVEHHVFLQSVKWAESRLKEARKNVQEIQGLLRTPQKFSEFDRARLAERLKRAEAEQKYAQKKLAEAQAEADRLRQEIIDG